MAWWNPWSIEDSGERKVIVEKKSTDYLKPLEQFMVYGATEDAGTPKAAMDLYAASTSISIPVNRIARSIAGLTPVIKIGNDKITAHPLLDLLRNPCPDFTSRLFMKSLAIDYLVTGEAFVNYLGDDKRPPVEMYRISPTLMSHDIKHGFIDYLQLSGEVFTGTYRREADKRFVDETGFRSLGHIRDFSSKDNSMGRGQSILISASNTARQQVLGMEHNLALLKNGGRMSLVFHFDNDLDEDEFEVVKQRVQEQFGGTHNAGKIGVTAGGKLAIDNVGMTNQDMDWSNSQDLANKIGAMVYDFPLPLLAMDAATRSNFGEAREMLYDDAVLPVADTLFGGIQEAIGELYGLPSEAKLTYDEDEITALQDRRIRQIKVRGEIGIESDNELRGILGREPYDGGDLIYKGSNQIPVGTDIVTEELDGDIDD